MIKVIYIIIINWQAELLFERKREEMTGKNKEKRKRKTVNASQYCIPYTILSDTVQYHSHHIAPLWCPFSVHYDRVSYTINRLTVHWVQSSVPIERCSAGRFIVYRRKMGQKEVLTWTRSHELPVAFLLPLEICSAKKKKRSLRTRRQLFASVEKRKEGTAKKQSQKKQKLEGRIVAERILIEVCVTAE